MTEEKTCYNCGNKNCHIFYSAVKQDVVKHHETYEYNDFDCVNHDKWKEMKVEEIRTDNTKTLKNALERIAELEEKTSVLLSCKNCPENKDGLICQKEYENKCLAQKIQFIKELQQENAELKAQIEKKMEEIRTDNTETLKNALERIAELKNQVSYLEDNLRVARKDRENLQLDVAKGLKEFVKDYPATALRYLANEKYVEQLTKAKEIIEELYNIIPASMADYAKEPMEHARKFMTEE